MYYKKFPKILFLLVLSVVLTGVLLACDVFNTEDTVKYKDVEGGKGLSEYDGISTSNEFVVPDEVGGEKVVEILPFAFASSDNLKKLTIGKNVERISCRAFCNIPNLTAFAVAEGNEHFSVVDGVLYSKDGTVLIAYPNKREQTAFVIPDTVVEIAENAFYMCGNLKSLTLSQNVRKVSDYACIKCTGMQTLVLNDGLEEIGRDAFSYCDALTSLILPASLKKVGDYAFFSQSTSITEFKAYCSPDVLHSKDWQPRKTAYENSALQPEFLSE